MSSVLEISPSAPTLTGNFNGQNVKLRPITVEKYDAMIESGVFDENDQVELLNGALVDKMPKGNEHSIYNDIVATYFIQKFGDKVYVRNQNPIWLDDFSEPEPDVVLVKPPFNKYFKARPTPEEIYLILEVSDTTLGYDRNTKGEAYSRAGIRQYLVMNVQEKTIEDYRQPSTDGYQFKQTYRIGEEFNLVAFPEITIAVSDFFPNE
jgi:Uma2 family endonuclease